MSLLVPYRSQRGAGHYPVFIGRSYQRGRGFGSVLSSVFRNLLVPAAKNVGKSLLKTGLQKTSGVLSGIADGKNVRQAVMDELTVTPRTVVSRAKKRHASQTRTRRTKQPRVRTPGRQTHGSGKSIFT